MPAALDQGSPDALTPRETQVLRLVARGMTSVQIARRPTGQTGSLATITSRSGSINRLRSARAYFGTPHSVRMSINTPTTLL